jgi:bifunctional DNase/RNase
VKNDVIPVKVRAVIPAKEHGCAIFVGNSEKVFTIYVDASIGAAISMFMQNVQKERPLTHDLIGHILRALNVKLERVIINDLQGGTYFARLILRASNSVQQEVVEIDARPSDSIALAVQADAAIYVARKVWDEVENVSELLRSLESGGELPPPPTE